MKTAFTKWVESEAGQRALLEAEHAPDAGLSMAWDAAIREAMRVCGPGMTKSDGTIPDHLDACLLIEVLDTKFVETPRKGDGSC